MLAELLSPEDWSEIATSDAVIIDATWGIPGTEDTTAQGILPGAVFFDLAALKALPLTERTNDVVASMLGDIGVTAGDDLVIYDRRGVFSAPRLWWLLQRVGHRNAAILNGGLPAMLRAGLAPVLQHNIRPKAIYEPQPSNAKDVLFDEILKTDAQIVDARSSGRFYGTEPEPRAGLRSGHMPNALSLPYGSLLDGGFIKADADIAEAIGAAGIDLNKPIITTCGSGVTAAGLAFIFTRLGAKDVRVYTGSWSEYGASDAPVAII